jgi:LysR family transcriptional regulator (chromosome initiation inhibitor)
MAAVTADPQPVQGCQVLPLGTLRYRALASPAFMQRFFATGVTPPRWHARPCWSSTARMRCRAAMCAASPAALTPPVHWLPEARLRQSHRGRPGLGHGPDLLVAGHL